MKNMNLVGNFVLQLYFSHKKQKCNRSLIKMVSNYQFNGASHKIDEAKTKIPGLVL